MFAAHAPEIDPATLPTGFFVAHNYVADVPVSGIARAVEPNGGDVFVQHLSLGPKLVHSTLDLRAELEVLILKLGNPGGVVLTGGDLDNQLKTLLDALRQPHAGSELPPGATPEEQEQPHFYCLLEDDRLITRVDLSADRWLAPPNPSHVHVHLLVRTKPSPITKHNLFLG